MYYYLEQLNGKRFMVVSRLRFLQKALLSWK